MKRICLSLAVIFGLAGATAQAQSDDLDERIRSYILENPEVILEALTILSEREAQSQLAAQIAQFPEIFDEPARHGLGDPSATLRVVEFFDYRCAPCKAMHPVLKDFVAAHPNVRIEMRHLPILSPGSERAARFALAVREIEGDAAYARVHEQLWGLRGPLNTAGFERIAHDEGLAVAPILATMDSDAITARIDYNRDLAITLGVLGTPAFVTPNSVTFGQSDITELADRWLSQ